ncbi:hypothetical protein BZG36_01702 [Bifiguratus adelaidae]|uniref:XPG-I domain-containing protein n=1 Tax=Bifiguratus adelaidae TaxID=1938954 RepID=A0A261Y550_9FUNG|nr:hypothetical protein BZG36_01702 [Bifiguratus adelaidae]
MIPQEALLALMVLTSNTFTLRRYVRTLPSFHKTLFCSQKRFEAIWIPMEVDWIKLGMRAVHGINQEVALLEQLDLPIDPKETSLSLGQKQLLAFARAIVENAKIIIMDEATSSIHVNTQSNGRDVDTSTFLDQDIPLPTSFNRCTVLCIAHKLSTIMRFDRVMVLDGGRMVEYDTLDRLLQQQGLFAKMSHLTGFYTLTYVLRAFSITPIMIFDGDVRIKEKRSEHARRKQDRLKLASGLQLELERGDRLVKALDMFDDGDMEVKGHANGWAVDRTAESLRFIHEQAADALSLTRTEARQYTRGQREMSHTEVQLLAELVQVLSASHERAKYLESLTDLKDQSLKLASSFRRRSVRVQRSHRDECRELLDRLKVPHCVVEEVEAEAVCARLCQAGTVDGVVSEDTDTLLFAEAPLYRYVLHPSHLPLRIDPLEARKALSLSREAFVDMGILCGTDFSFGLGGGPLENVGPVTAMRLMQEHGSLENVFAWCRQAERRRRGRIIRTKEEADKEMEMARRVFLEPINLSPYQDAITQALAHSRSAMASLNDPFLDDFWRRHDLGADDVARHARRILWTWNVREEREAWLKGVTTHGHPRALSSVESNAVDPFKVSTTRGSLEGG